MKNKIFLIALLFLVISFSKLHAESDTLWTQTIGSTVRTVKFSPDGQYVYAAAEGRVPLQINAKNGDIIRGFLGFNYTSFDHGHALDISPDGKTLVAGDVDKLYFYDTENGEIKDSLISPTKGTFYNRFSDVKFTYDNKYLIASVNYDDDFVNTYSYVIIWDLENKKEITRLYGRQTLKLAIDQQNKTLAYIDKVSDNDDYYINLLEIGTWKSLGVLKGHTSRITDLSFSPDGSLLASCDEYSNVNIWNIGNKEMLIGYKRIVRNTFSVSLVNQNLITFGGGNFENFNITTSNLTNTNTISTYNLTYPLDFEYYKNILVVVSDFTGVICLKADRLTSVSSDFTKGIIYPNPATNLLTIPKTFFENNFISLSVNDITGKTVYSNDINQNEDLIIDVSNYPKGTYYINYNYKSGSQSTRFIKE